jgi:SAM-dependent methyltransferase
MRDLVGRYVHAQNCRAPCLPLTGSSQTGIVRCNYLFGFASLPIACPEFLTRMPTIEDNRSFWGDTSHWAQCGDEWSKPWGGPCMQWYGSILPRISAFVPTDTILEIAPGYGRWTAFLKDLCKRLIIVDLSESCIERCKQRFADCSHISYFVNDGKSLEMVGDGGVDFVFSFDSLVHAEDEVLKAYAAEIVKKLRPNGAAFLHHSNLGQYIRRTEVQDQLSKVPKLLGLLKRLGVCDEVTKQHRARSMTAGKMAMFAEEHNLQCVSQELVTWGSRFALVDCLSTLVPRGCRWSRRNHVFRNVGFMLEAKRLSDLSHLYGWPGTADGE